MPSRSLAPIPRVRDLWDLPMRCISHRQAPMFPMRCISHRQAPMFPMRCISHRQAPILPMRCISHRHAPILPMRCIAHRQAPILPTRCISHREATILPMRCISHREATILPMRCISHRQAPAPRVRDLWDSETTGRCISHRQAPTPHVRDLSEHVGSPPAVCRHVWCPLNKPTNTTRGSNKTCDPPCRNTQITADTIRFHRVKLTKLRTRPSASCYHQVNLSREGALSVGLERATLGHISYWNLHWNYRVSTENCAPMLALRIISFNIPVQYKTSAVQNTSTVYQCNIPVQYKTRV